ncbi:MAG: hypothetical protein EPO13_04575 [Actinomycetota bacterium]|nr:MAG: hypothetical protein EPO13_04575 [Actinomycetota bacterium]
MSVSTEPRVMAPHHTAFVVPDVAVWMEEFSTVLGLQWREVRVAPIRLKDQHGVEHEHTTTYVHSKGAPSIELFEGIPGTILEGGDTPRFHHIGYWVDDLVTRSREVNDCGWAWLQDAGPTTPPPAAFHKTPFGYLELLNLEFPRGEYYHDLFPPGRTPPGYVGPTTP